MRRLLRFIQSHFGLSSRHFPVLLGIVLGLVLKAPYTFPTVEGLFRFAGMMLSRMLKLVCMPLTITGLLKELTSTKTQIDKNIAGPVKVYLVASTLTAVTAGLILALCLKPGVTSSDQEVENEALFTLSAFVDLCNNMASDSFTPVLMKQRDNSMGDDSPDGFNLNGMVFLTITIGLAVPVGTFQTFPELISDLHVIVGDWNELVFRCFPLGLVSLGVIDIIKDGDSDIYKLGLFMSLTVIGLMIQGAVLQPLLYALIARCNPFAVIRGVYPALLKALLTGSSTATLPVTLHCLQQRLRIIPRVTDSMLALSIRAWKNGTVLEKVIAVVFICQLSDMSLDLNLVVSFGVAAVVWTIIDMRTPEPITIFYIVTAAQAPLRNTVLLVLLELLLVHIYTVVDVLSQCFSISLAHQLLINYQRRTMEAGSRSKDA